MQKPHILQRLRGAYSGAMVGCNLSDKLNLPTGPLYARKTRTTPLNFESDISLQGTWTITF